MLYAEWATRLTREHDGVKSEISFKQTTEMPRCFLMLWIGETELNVKEQSIIAVFQKLDDGFMVKFLSYIGWIHQSHLQKAPTAYNVANKVNTLFSPFRKLFS